MSTMYHALILGFLVVAGKVCAQQAPKSPKSTPAATSVPTTKPSPPTPPMGPERFQELRPNAVSYKIERKYFGANAYFKRVELYWVAPVEKPRAYIVVATDMAKPRLPLEDPQWMNYARERKLGILSLGFDLQDPVQRISETAGDLEGRIQRLAQEAFGENLKGACFASGQGGVWMHRIMMRRPWQWGFWCTSDISRYPFVPRGIAYPPGVVLSTLPGAYHENLFFFQDLRRTNVGNKVNFVAVDGKGVAKAFLDRYGQNALDAVLAGGVAQSRWYHVHTEADCATLAKQPGPTVQSWMPGEEFPGAWKLLNQERPKTPDCVIAATDINLTELATSAKLYFRIPGRVKEGLPVKFVQVWLTWEADDELLLNRLKSNTDLRAAIWERERVGVIAMNVKKLGIEMAPKTSDFERMTKVARIVHPEFWKAVGNAIRELGWPGTPYCLFANGSGADFAQAMIAQDPGRYLAVHLHAATFYNPPASGSEKIPLLVTSGGKHPGYEASLKYFREASSRQLPVMFKAPMGAAGTIDEWTTPLGVGFFVWTKSTSDMMKTQPQVPEKLVVSSVGDYLRNRLSESKVVADVTLGRVFLEKDNAQVPLVNQIRMPDAELEELWRVGSAPKPPVAGQQPNVGAQQKGETAPLLPNAEKNTGGK